MFKLEIYTTSNKSFYIQVKSLNDFEEIMTEAYIEAFNLGIDKHEVLNPEFMEDRV